MPSRRKPWWWIMGALPVILLLAAFGLRATGTRKDIERWQGYQIANRAAGEDLGMERWLPPPATDDRNVLAHPWIAGFVGSENSPQAEVVTDLQPWANPALDHYEMPVEGQSWFEGREVERNAVLQAGRDHVDDFRAIHEAAARSGFTLPVDRDVDSLWYGGPWTRIADLVPMLGVHADASMASGDEAAAAADLEAMLRFGGHLRAQNFLLASVTGANFELRAVRIIEAGMEGRVFSSVTRRRLLSAMRTRSVPEELFNVMRVERGIFLKSINEAIRNAPPPGFRQRVSSYFRPPARQIATNSLYFCETLDVALHGPVDRETWESFAQTSRVAGGDPSSDIARACFSLIGGVPEGLFVQEERFTQLRQRLAK